MIMQIQPKQYMDEFVRNLAMWAKKSALDQEARAEWSH